MEKVLPELFGHIVLGTHTVQTVPKCIWIWQWVYISRLKQSKKYILLLDLDIFQHLSG